jgi:hypothetical protein
MNNLTDVLGNSDLQCGTKAFLTHDRFCRENASLYLQNGYLYYFSQKNNFSEDFTITAWIKLNSYARAYIVYSAVYSNTNDDSICFNIETDGSISGYIFNGNSQSQINSFPSFILSLNDWYHVAFVLRRKIGYIYVNGIVVANGTLYSPKNVSRNNYVNYYGDATYNNVAIYQVAFSEAVILNDYNQSSNYGKFHINVLM